MKIRKCECGHDMTDEYKKYNIKEYNKDLKYFVICSKCEQYTTSAKETPEEALRAWNNNNVLRLYMKRF